MRKSFRLILVAVFLFGLILGVVGSSGTASANSPLVHVVRWGDTLFSIANRYGTTMNAIMAANGMRNANFIYIGQRLVIPTGSAPLPPTTGTYVVQAGDTLFSIANRHGTTVAALMQANGLYNYWIYVGQTLRIPGHYVPQPVPQPIPVPPQGVYHIVRPGEWLSLIAARYGSSVYAIQIANNLANPSLLWVGQRLFIPGGVAPINPPVYQPLPPVYVPPVKPPVVVLPPPASSSASSVPVVVLPPPASSSASSVPVVVIPSSSASSVSVPGPLSGTWEAVLLVNTTGTGPCSLGTFVQNRTDWPVVVATTDGSWISEPKLTGAKPERGPYYVEFAHACTGVWRVIPLGLNIYADVELKGGHAEIEFRQRP